MGAEDYSIVWNAKRSASAVDLPVGAVVVKTTAGDYDLATSANRATYGRPSAGIARQPSTGKTVTFNFQFVGIVSPDISGLGNGIATTVSVSNAGFLQRGSAGEVVGRCDADGTCYLIFGDISGVGAGASLSGTTNGIISMTSTVLGTADAYWTCPAAGVHSAANDTVAPSGHGYIAFVAGASETYATAVLPAFGTIRYSDLLASGPGQLNSVTVVSYRSTALGNSFAALGISGGSPFLGDPAHASLTNIFGNGIQLDAGPSGKVQLAGLSATGGGAGKFVAIDASGNLTAATPSGFTAGGDLSGTSSSQTVIGISGASPIPITPAVLQWVTGATSPTLKQADNTTASATAQTLTIQAPNATGVTSNGGKLALTSGTGTQAAGNVELQTGGTARLTVAPTLLTSTNPLAIGTNPATTGDVRHANNTSAVVIRNAGNSANFVAVASNASDEVTIACDGTYNNGPSILRMYPVTQGIFGIGGGTNVASWTSSGFSFNLACNFGGTISGYQALSAPFHYAIASITQSSTTDTTLTAAQYVCPILNVGGTPGGNFNIIAPNTTGAYFIVRNATANILTIKVSGQTGVGIAASTSRQVFCDGTDYRFASG